jgi:hypothetical protein
MALNGRRVRETRDLLTKNMGEKRSKGVDRGGRGQRREDEEKRMQGEMWAQRQE